MSWSASVSAIPATDAVTALRVAFKQANPGATREDNRQFELAAVCASGRVGEVQSHNGLVNIVASGPGFNATDPDDGGSPYFDAEAYFEGRAGPRTNADGTVTNYRTNADGSVRHFYTNPDGSENTDPFDVEVTPAGPEFASSDPLRKDVDPRTGVPFTEVPLVVPTDPNAEPAPYTPRPPRRRPNR